MEYQLTACRGARVRVDDLTLTPGVPVKLTKDQADRVREIPGVKLEQAKDQSHTAGATGDDKTEASNA